MLWCQISSAVAVEPRDSGKADICQIPNTQLTIEGIQCRNGYYFFNAEVANPLKGSVSVDGKNFEISVADALKETKKNFECDAVLSVRLEKRTPAKGVHNPWHLKMTIEHVNIYGVSVHSHHVTVSPDSGRGIEASQEALDALKGAGILNL
ncbi:unnamed protein product [Sympodiomycopsis kandeliae]